MIVRREVGLYYAEMSLLWSGNKCSGETLVSKEK